MAGRSVGDGSDDGDVILIKPLEGWLTLAEAAPVLDVTKQGIHAMVWISMQFDFDKDVRAVGERPVYVLRESAVLAKKAERDAAAKVRAAKAEQRAAVRAKVSRRGLALRPGSSS